MASSQDPEDIELLKGDVFRRKKIPDFFREPVVGKDQVDEVRQLTREIGLDDVWFKTAQIYDYQNDPNGLIPSTEQFSRYKKDAAGQTIPKNKMPNHCWKMWHSNVITWDGKVVPCCFDKDAQHIIGVLGEKEMKEIWESKNYNEFRAELMRSRKNIDICSNCSEGLKVWS